MKFGELLLLILSWGFLSVHAQQNATLICPDSIPFTFEFKILRKISGKSPPDLSTIENFFQNKLPSLQEIFVTRTTSLNDICQVETLSVTDQGSQSATMLAVRSNKKKEGVSSSGMTKKPIRNNQNKRKLDSTMELTFRRIRPVYAVVVVRGTPAFQAIITAEVSDAISSALGGNVQVSTLIIKGPPTFSSLQFMKFSSSASSSFLPTRSHSFSAYATSPTFKSYIPVIIADPNYQGEIPLNLVSISDGSTLQGRFCSVNAVYRSPRKSNSWTQLPGPEASMFSIKAGASNVRLSLYLSKSDYYYRLRNQRNLNIDASKLWQNLLSSLNFGRLTGRKVQETFDSGSGANVNNTSPEIDSEATTIPVSSNNSSDDEVFYTENYAAADYVNDYVIVFTCTDTISTTTNVYRADVTIVPRVVRSEAGGASSSSNSALVCEPGNMRHGLQFAEQTLPYQSTNCPIFPRRNASNQYVLDEASFTGLHPEESEWVNKRLNKTNEAMIRFIQNNLPWTIPMNFSKSSKVKLAISVSGGGKRSAFNAAGVLSSLSKAGVLDLSTWMAGASGGGWLLGALYAGSQGKPALVDPESHLNSHIEDLSKSIFDGTFRANECLTNFGGSNPATTLPVAPFKSNPSSDLTDKIFCQSELKFNSPATAKAQAGNPALGEYWSGAVGYQFLGKEVQERGFTMSGLMNDALLSQFNAPLPIIQLQQKGGGAEGYRLWEVSPFDVAVHKDSLHLSFPTQLLGTDVTNPTRRCTLQGDQLALFMGMTSWAFPIVNDVAASVKDLVCEERGSACQEIMMSNPFYGYTGPSRQSNLDLSTTTDAKFVDGATQQNIPLWEFVTPTRQADVVVVIDSSGFLNEAALSSDPPGGSCAASDQPLNKKCSSALYYASTNRQCCNLCKPVLGFSCWPTSDPSQNYLYKLSSYSAEHTLPSKLPKSTDPPSKVKATLSKITFFGCDEVGKTAIVYIPNRVVSSGKSGFTTLNNVLEFNPAYNIPNTPLSADEIFDVFNNGKNQLSSSFNKCLACLFYATSMNRVDVWQTNPDCAQCYRSYCY